MHWLKHAFAVETSPAEPTAAERDVMDRLCREIVRRQLTTPALAFLEMSRPLGYLGAQALHYFAPVISALATTADHQHLATLLERRDALDRICRRLEELSASTGDSARTTDAP